MFARRAIRDDPAGEAVDTVGGSRTYLAAFCPLFPPTCPCWEGQRNGGGGARVPIAWGLIDHDREPGVAFGRRSLHVPRADYTDFMATGRQLRNLRRGGVPASAETAAHARAALEARRAKERRIGELASEDPFAALDELHPVLVKHLARLIREEERAGGQPSRNVTDRIREVRQLTERLVDWRAAHGMMDVADDFFATLDERVGAVTALMPEGPRPVVRPPS
jgi:hypothetical protein